MKVHLPVFFCCVFASIFLFHTLVSLPFPPPHQVETLLAFKNEFPTPTCSHSVLRSWTRNTSSFRGVVFSNKTGVVTELHLERACLRGTIKKNSNLFKFHHLRYLDLSFNLFDSDSSSFPAEFGRLANLEFLNFRDSGVVGEVPSSIHNLSRLTFLDLSDNRLRGAFPLVYNITTLSFLNISYNNFFGTIPSSLFTMPSLLKLDLRSNHLRDPLEILNSSSSSSKLESLSLGRNFFSGRVLEPISKLVKLTYLDLSFLNIIYPINIVFLPLKSLEYLDLSGNSMSRLNTSSDHALPKLIGLKLSNCNIVEFPKFLVTLQSLKYLDLSWNRLSRLNTSSDYELTKLIELDASNCNMVEFPKFLMNFKSLEYLDLSSNRLKGKVPGWLWNLPLTKVSLFLNSLDGFEGSLKVLLNSSLEMLDLSSNAFGGSLPIPPPTMDTMAAYNNSFTGDLSLSLCNARKLSLLDLTYNNFSGPIPQCLGDSVEGAVILRHNNLIGKLPDTFCRSGSLTTFDFSYNQITGELPRSLANCTRLELLNVGSNNITDTFPFWLKALPVLQVIVLQSNRFHGPIHSPQHPLSFPELRVFDISSNNFSGSLPSNYFVNWSTSFPAEDGPMYMEDNYLHGYSLSMRIRGLYMEFNKILVFYAAIDFSGNKLGGQIPESIGLLKSLIVLNLSNNDFNGHIPSLANITQLESLDVSRNQLSGKIPQELRSLSFLEYVNMSHNKLTGQIPQGTQITAQPESSFEGNIGLCGLPLQETCFRGNRTPLKQEHVRGNRTPSKQEHVMNSKAVTIGYMPTLIMFGLYMLLLDTDSS